MPNAECRMPNAECRMPNAECRMPNAECRMPNAECKTNVVRDGLFAVSIRRSVDSRQPTNGFALIERQRRGPIPA
jgi:hypothetical protein